ncbi:hypothetical protein [Synechococcus sp. CC9616]|uniref:hypothetical protein n=1 Tax=Synechococcus sp. CC9616 TaxID=110663 RepID=UPI00048B82E6|nr:hypothetical protein [Synechococcus sp. CC9616]
MTSPPEPSAAELARFLEQRGELTKPWNLQMLRLQKLKEEKGSMTPEAYLEKIRDAHQDLMRLGRFWEGREAEVFSGTYQPSELIEPRPGSAEDR